VGSLFSAENLQYLWNEARRDQAYYWWLIGSCIRAIDCHQNQLPWPGERPFCTLFQNTCVFGAHGYSWGSLGDEVSNDSEIIENVDFQVFRTLRLRHLKKWGQHYQWLSQGGHGGHGMLFCCVEFLCIFFSRIFSKCLRLLGLCPKTLYGALPLDPAGGLPSPIPPLLSP